MKEKKEKETEPSPRQAQQSKPTHGFSKKKKKQNNTESKIKLTHHTHGHVAIEKTNPQYTDTVYTEQKQNKPKAILCLSKKKKKPNTEPLYQNGKTKPKKPQYSLLSRRNSLLVVIAIARSSSSSSSLAPHRRLQIVDGRSQSQITLLSSSARCSMLVDRRSL